MAGLAALLMLCCMLSMHIVAAVGLADARLVNAWTVMCVAGLLIVYALIRSGYSLRFPDPSLTHAQILYAIACNAVAYVIAGPARGIALPILAVVMMFGMFGLTPRQMIGVMVYALVMFGIAGAVVEWRSEPGHSQALSLAYAVMIVVVLLSSTFLTRRVQATREHLRRQRYELAQAVEQVRKLATHDELTGLPNRRYMLEVLRLEVLRAQRSGQPLLVAQLDIDHFKTVNDTHGHAMGDRALQVFARTVRASVRASDVLARWGGEEFILLLCNTPLAPADDLLERVRHAVAAQRLERPGSPPLQMTVSIGVTCLRPGEALEEALERADRALYSAKAAGRNRVAWMT
ncbi:diguanylate cyclase [Acidovorax sp. Leaf160]|nr:diguanylate cyclase [Acidovorax sp. Leaf160]KQR62195.1 diguanylate cyclase [Acidovorax sp. Leaf160]